MNGRVSSPGKTRLCPHCKATILESATVCPGCNHHLRFERGAGTDNRAQPRVTALRVEGSFGNTEGNDASEYTVVVSIKNDRGQEIDRKVIGVGALTRDEKRTVTLSVDVSGPRR